MSMEVFGRGVVFKRDDILKMYWYQTGAIITLQCHRY